jgi:hypothetical protein
MRLRTIGFAGSMVLGSAAFSSSFAQSAAVSEKTFDWIFFAIVGIPFVLALVDTLINDGKRSGIPKGVDGHYPPTVSNAVAVSPLSAWRTSKEEEVAARPQPNRSGY